MKGDLQRRLVGAIAIGLLLGAGILLWVGSQDDSSQTVTALGSACLRLGLIAAALWFAMPQVVAIATRLPKRLTVAIVVGGLIVVITKGKALVLVLLIIIAVACVEFVGWLMKPLPRRRGKR